MPSPFPGMDPYIERPAIWPDFHFTFMAYIKSALLPQVRPRYAVMTAARRSVTEAGHLPGPEVSVFELWPDEVRERSVHILDFADEGRIVTALEVLGPAH